jgi:catechol 2,3-dioxygenase-like lactoylglutathione lyase family enzyme
MKSSYKIGIGMQFIQIKETSLYVFNLGNSKSFYNGLLEMEIISDAPGRHIFFRAGSSVLLCFAAEVTAKENNLPAHGGNGQIHIAFEVSVEEYESVKQNLMNKEIDIEHEQEWPGNFKSFYFRDPDKHLLEVVQTGMWDK